MKFNVEGKVRGKARPRFYNGHAVTPRETRDYEDHIVYEYLHAHGSRYERPVRVSITAHLGVPKSESISKQTMRVQGQRPTKKPDVDNIAKVVLDALNGVAYEDNKQVVELKVKKVWSLNEGLEVEIQEVQ